MTRVEESKGGMDEMVSPLPENEASYSPLQLYFLRRLNRLLRLRHEQGRELNGEGVRLIDRAIYSAYCDACDVGVADQAQNLLRRLPVSSSRRSEG
ncbi:MAG: hypothetical protein A2Y74_08780 [Actinobacteria bacterium RBG_13_63_9]|nr:MAG: hypothetical protein A2Y74_08780 [Actinobacteria bacterium RBG_13_63_9]